MNKKLKILISIILVVVLIAGGYVGNMFGVFNRGNYGEYSLKNTDTVQDSQSKTKPSYSLVVPSLTVTAQWV